MAAGNPKGETQLFPLYRLDPSVEELMENERRTILRVAVIGPNGSIWFHLLNPVLGHESTHALEAELHGIWAQRDLSYLITDKALKFRCWWEWMHSSR